jgi:hypothetical protein
MFDNNGTMDPSMSNYINFEEFSTRLNWAMIDRGSTLILSAVDKFSEETFDAMNSQL